VGRRGGAGGEERRRDVTPELALTRRTGQGKGCRMDLPVPTTSVGTRTDYSVGPWTTRLALHGT
jgi:hypothetical protein